MDLGGRWPGVRSLSGEEKRKACAVDSLSCVASVCVSPPGEVEGVEGAKLSYTVLPRGECVDDDVLETRGRIPKEGYVTVSRRLARVNSDNGRESSSSSSRVGDVRVRNKARGEMCVIEETGEAAVKER